MSHIVIIGYGNPLRGDDGAGWRAAERLQAVWPAGKVRVLTCRQLTPELAAVIAPAALAIFVDAARGQPAGAVQVTYVRSADAADPLLAHSLEPSELLAFTRRVYGAAPRAWLVAVYGEQFGYHEGLSGRVDEVLPRVVQAVSRLISSEAACDA